MKTEWDYTNLADAYLKRPDYAQEAIDKMLFIANVHDGDAVCDVGAGVAHLTLMLEAKGLDVKKFPCCIYSFAQYRKEAC